MNEHLDDININKNLKIIYESKDPYQFDLTNFIDKNERRIFGDYQSKQFAQLMEREGLIRIYGDFGAIEKLGFEIQKNGG